MNTPKAAPVRANDFDLGKAIERIFSMGQNYWAEADSESYAANKRSVATLEKFRAFKAELLDRLTAAENDRTSGRVTDGVALVLQQALLYATTSEHYREPHRNSLLMYAKQYKAEIEAALASENRR